MTLNKNSSRRIHILREEVARKIAAGEVIDRPFSVVRELLDNSIDAESKEINLYLEKGGSSYIRVVDNGLGMDAEDLQFCFLPHATSKITEEADLYLTTTLGFRGEALSSVANCSKLDITSCLKDQNSGNKLIVRAGKLLSLEKCQARQGTIVDVSDLFYNMPARKKFLKSASGETTMCKTVFLDKALAFPDIAFRFFVNDKLSLFLPAASRLERITGAYQEALQKTLLVEEEKVCDDFSITVVGGRAEMIKPDRRYIQIFVNNRRINEYSLVQAVQYGYSSYMPGGNFPAAFVFIQINPQLIDFNIHPAKRECKFLNLQEIHHSLTTLIKSYLNKFQINLAHILPADSPIPPEHSPLQNKLENFNFEYPAHQPGRSTHPLYTKEHGAVSYNGLKAVQAVQLKNPGQEEATEPLLYLGQVFKLFLVAEYNGNLFIVDQHAAHEKILYEQYRKAAPVMQELLFPIVFETENEEQQILEKNRNTLQQCGIEFIKTGNNLFEITSLSTSFHAMETSTVIEFLKGIKGTTANLEAELFSMLACKAAIKEGDTVDSLTALNLLKETFKLEDARCPHGRPIWHVLSKSALFKLMGRT